MVLFGEPLLCGTVLLPITLVCLVQLLTGGDNDRADLGGRAAEAFPCFVSSPPPTPGQLKTTRVASTHPNEIRVVCQRCDSREHQCRLPAPAHSFTRAVYRGIGSCKMRAEGVSPSTIVAGSRAYA